MHNFPNRSIYKEYVELKSATVKKNKNTDDCWKQQY